MSLRGTKESVELTTIIINAKAENIFSAFFVLFLNKETLRTLRFWMI